MDLIEILDHLLIVIPSNVRCTCPHYNVKIRAFGWFEELLIKEH
jgi:hypothetical protein